MIQEAIAKAVGGTHLGEDEMVAVMYQVMDGQATPAQIGALLIALRIKGETVEEIAGAARVAKHGNRSVSSRCGSADLMEALGIPLDLTPEQVGACIDQVGIGFLFAPLLHGAMRHAIGPRREIGLRTIFNLLGLLTNPAGATAQVVGVYDAALVEPLARVLGRQAFVVHGPGGLDELSSTGASRAARLENGQVSTLTITPEELGLKRARPEELTGDDAAQNAGIAPAVLSGQPGACRDTVLMNAAARLAVGQGGRA